MAVFYVEIVRPFVPNVGVKIDFNVYKAEKFSADVLSPDMVAVFQVEHVKNSTEAVSCVMLLAAGHSPCVRLIFGGKNKSA